MLFEKIRILALSVQFSTENTIPSDCNLRQGNDESSDHGMLTDPWTTLNTNKL